VRTGCCRKCGVESPPARDDGTRPDRPCLRHQARPRQPNLHLFREIAATRRNPCGWLRSSHQFWKYIFQRHFTLIPNHLPTTKPVLATPFLPGSAMFAC